MNTIKAIKDPEIIKLTLNSEATKKKWIENEEKSWIKSKLDGIQLKIVWKKQGAYKNHSRFFHEFEKKIIFSLRNYRSSQKVLRNFVWEETQPLEWRSTTRWNLLSAPRSYKLFALIERSGHDASKDFWPIGYPVTEKKSFMFVIAWVVICETYIAWQKMWLSGQNDCKDLTFWQRLTERQHQMISYSFHHLHRSRKLIIRQFQHRS